MQKIFKLIILLLINIINITVCIHAQSTGNLNSEIEITLKADTTDIEINQKLILNVEVKQKGNYSIGTLQVAGLDTFRSIGTSEIDNVQINNNSIMSVHSQEYHLIPTQIGEFVIGPASVNINNQKISSNTLKIKIRAASATPTATTSGSTNKQAIGNQIGPQEQLQIIKSDNKLIRWFIILFVLIILLIFFIYKYKYAVEDKSPEISVNINKSSVIYPEINDPEFEIKIDKIIKDYILYECKFSPDAMTYEEIYQKLITENYFKGDHSALNEVFQLLLQKKYGQKTVDQAKILEVVQHLFA